MNLLPTHRHNTSRLMAPKHRCRASDTLHLGTHERSTPMKLYCLQRSGNEYPMNPLPVHWRSTSRPKAHSRRDHRTNSCPPRTHAGNPRKQRKCHQHNDRAHSMSYLPMHPRSTNRQPAHCRRDPRMPSNHPARSHEGNTRRRQRCLQRSDSACSMHWRPMLRRSTSRLRMHCRTDRPIGIRRHCSQARRPLDAPPRHFRKRRACLPRRAARDLGRRKGQAHLSLSPPCRRRPTRRKREP